MMRKIEGKRRGQESVRWLDSITNLCMLSHFSLVWLFATLWTVAHQTSLFMGFSRHEYCSGLPSLLQWSSRLWDQTQLINSVDMNLSKLWKSEGQGRLESAVCGYAKSQTWLSDYKTITWPNLTRNIGNSPLKHVWSNSAGAERRAGKIDSLQSKASGLVHQESWSAVPLEQRTVHGFPQLQSKAGGLSREFSAHSAWIWTRKQWAIQSLCPGLLPCQSREANS